MSQYQAPPLVASEPEPEPTPRQIRHRLNELEAWWGEREAAFDPEARVYVRALFEYAHLPAHLEAIRSEIGRFQQARRAEVAA